MKKIGIITYCGIFALFAMDEQDVRDLRITANNNIAKNGGNAGGFFTSMPSRVKTNSNKASGVRSFAGAAAMDQDLSITRLEANENNAEGANSKAGIMISKDSASFINDLFGERK